MVYCLMSGGVDSSVAAFLLKKNGYDVKGVTLKIFDRPECKTTSSCCGSAYDIGIAYKVASIIGIPFEVIDLRKEFKELVIEKFVSFYKNGLTPNPCVFCNDSIKFDFVLKKLQGYIATGHYARIINGKLFKGFDRAKDQSYFLCTVNRAAFSRILFPLGEYEKSEVRKIAYENGFPNWNKKDSYDLCFTDNHIQYLENEIGDGAGAMFYEGRVVATHTGYYKFTYGKRVKLSFGKRIYVKAIEPSSRSVYLATREQLYSNKLRVYGFNMLSDYSSGRYVVKTRSMHEGAYAYVDFFANYIEFGEKQFALTPGQVVCVYNGDEVVAGGIIKEVL